jgi:hypothetical protein
MLRRVSTRRERVKTRVKVVMAASVFLGASLIGMILSVSSNVGALIDSAYAA